MKILAIESSCDETSVAVVEDGKIIHSNCVLSQIDVHKVFGGVVPEIASRHHIENITVVIDEALKTAKMTMSDMDAVAVTEGPGLIGALLVGINAAKALAFAHGLPLIGVNHLAGHVYASHIESDLTFPLIALLVSGGHTELIYMQDHHHFKVLGETQDDAVGEAYDKVARVLDLPYPGGPYVDNLAQQGKDVYGLPRPYLHDQGYNFSFSGLKSAVINFVHNKEQRNEAFVKEDLCASFQASVCDVLIHKTQKAVDALGVKTVILAGGVAANKTLRSRLHAEITKAKVVVPPFKYCTDNAAMIGSAAYFQYVKEGKKPNLDLNGKSSLELDS